MRGRFWKIVSCPEQSATGVGENFAGGLIYQEDLLYAGRRSSQGVKVVIQIRRGRLIPDRFYMTWLAIMTDLSTIPLLQNQILLQ